MRLNAVSLRFTVPAFAIALVALALTPPAGPVVQSANASVATEGAPPPSGRTTAPSTRDAALAQERYYSSYGTPAPLSSSPDREAGDTGDGITWLGFSLALLGTLIAGLAAGPGLQRRYTRNRRGTSLRQAAPTPPEPGRTA